MSERSAAVSRASAALQIHHVPLSLLPVQTVLLFKILNSVVPMVTNSYLSYLKELRRNPLFFWKLHDTEATVVCEGDQRRLHL